MKCNSTNEKKMQADGNIKQSCLYLVNLDGHQIMPDPEPPNFSEVTIEYHGKLINWTWEKFKKVLLKEIQNEQIS